MSRANGSTGTAGAAGTNGAAHAPHHTNGTSTTAPEFTVIGDTYRFRWPALLVEAELSRFAEHRDSLVAELLIATLGEADGKTVRKLLHRSSFNLMAGETRVRLARALGEQRGDVDWRAAIEQICFLAVERRRDGDPTVDLRTVDPDERPRWFLRPYLEHGGPTILFAPGGSGKSYLSAAACVTIATGVPLFGQLVGTPGPVLYLDWETDRFTHAERLRALCKGAGIEQLPPVFYRQMLGSLSESLIAIQREIARLNAVAAVVDSLATARGGEPESADVTNKTLTCVRSFGIPTLIVDHVSKAAMQNLGQSGRASPFGSIFTENRARNTWSIRRAGEEDSDVFNVALVHEKTNNGRYQKRHAYTISFTNVEDAQGEERLDSVTIRPVNMAAVPDFEADLTLADRILNFIRQQHDRTATRDELAEGLDVPARKVGPRLSEMKTAGKLIYLKDRKRYGLAQFGGAA